MELSHARQLLYSDGSLRDIYVPHATIKELELFFGFAKTFIGPSDFRIGGIVAPLPPSYAEAAMMTADMNVMLAIPVGSSAVNCHFFSSDELELDFVPADFDEEKNWTALARFLQNLSNIMRRQLLITAENCPEIIHAVFSPNPES